MTRSSIRLLPFLLLLPVCVSLAAPPDETPRYTVTDLGTLSGTFTSSARALALNNLRQVVGTSRGVAFIWQRGEMVALEALPDAFESEANDINDAGVIAGTVNGQIPVVWEPGKGIRVLPLGFTAVFADARAISAAGQVVGGVTTPAGGGHHALFWDRDGEPVDLRPFGRAFAADINGRGTIVGAVQRVTRLQPGYRATTHATLWERPDRPKDLGTLGGRNSHAFGVNDAGLVVGSSGVPGRGQQAFLWTRSRGMRNLGTLGGLDSGAAAINTEGEVVGSSELRRGSAATHAFVWRGHRMEDLNRLIPPNSGWELQYAADINDHGHIVGSGRFRGEQRAFLLARRTRSF